MAQYQYDNAFFRYTTASNDHSAQRVAELLTGWLHPHSVVDFGCAQGAWLAAWLKAGATEVAGVDGDYVDRRQLRIAADAFTARDLVVPIDLGRSFDLAMSVEVAEHLPHTAAAQFVATLCQHAEIVLFSAAPPGQGGEHHINEQPYAYWRDLFQAQGYACLDAVRPRLRGDLAVQPWYRYNIFLYASVAGLKRLPPEVLATRIAAGAALPDLSPLRYQVRKAVVRQVPAPVADALARLKARVGGG